MSRRDDGSGGPAPPGTAAATEISPRQPSGTQDEPTARRHAEQLRRRRAAAWRCPPLADGHRDPLDEPGRSDWTDHERDAWRTAIGHLAALGYDVRPAVSGYVRRSARQVIA